MARDRARAARQGAMALALCGTLGACTRPHRMVEAPRIPPCRAAVDARAPHAQLAIAWWTPASEDDRHEHLEWCGTVGPAVVSSPEHVLVAPPHGDSLAIVSWNTHVGGGDLHALVRDLRGGRWTRGRPVRHFVLLLQEVFRAGPAVPPRARGPSPSAIRPSDGSRERVGVVSAARSLGLHLFYAPSMRNGESAPGRPDEDRGNAILSTMPLGDFRTIELPFEVQRRVAVAARVVLRLRDEVAMPLLLVSAHLDTRAPARRVFMLAPPGRTRQMKGLLQALPSDGAAVLGGDLNTWFGAQEGAYKEARQVFPQTPRGRGTTKGRLRLDHLFFRLPDGWTARWRVLQDTFGSDHRPVFGEIHKGMGE